MPQSLLAAAFGFLPRLFHSLPSHSALVNARRGFPHKIGFHGRFVLGGRRNRIGLALKKDGWMGGSNTVVFCSLC
ncbi:hypothetical protein IWX49DRAFT_163429 [Phyllosticta citricarpa]